MVISGYEYPVEGRASLVAGPLVANEGINTSSTRTWDEQRQAITERCYFRNLLGRAEQECGKNYFLTALFQPRNRASS
jgi:hypothetical protein